MEGLRLDLALASLLGDVSRSTVRRLIEEGKVLVGGRGAKPSRKVAAGESVEVEIPEAEELRLVPEARPVETLYGDPFLLVVNKPVGMPVHPAESRRTGTLMNALLSEYPDLGTLPDALRPGVVHRLDKDTSGLILVAKTEADRMALTAQVKARTVVRRYLALVWGTPEPPQGRIDAPIGRHPVHWKRMAVVQSASAREAVTDYRILLRLGPMTLVEARLRTGRTHQIRVHFAHLRHPLVGDPVYGGRQRRLLEALPEGWRRLVEGLCGQALHAYFLSFRHPRTGKELAFFSPPRQQMLDLISTARDFSG